MRIFSIQFSPSSGDIINNITRICDFVGHASSAGADLVVFPEMSDTGYDMSVITKKASTWDDKPLSLIQECSAKSKVNVVVGLSERVDDGIFNSIAILDRSGELIGRHRKTHLITAEPICEQNFMKFGSSNTVVDIEGIKFGVITCYEVRFPEISRKLTLEGVSGIIIPSAWPLVRLPHWRNLVQARAIENQIFVIACNRIGHDGNIPFAGNSMIVDPYGVVLSSGSEIFEDVLEANLKISRIAEVRSLIKMHQDRRPELY